VAGELDRAIPLWAQAQLADIFPHSKLLVLPECGHLTYFEEPDVFWENLKELARTKSAEFALAA